MIHEQNKEGYQKSWHGVNRWLQQVKWLLPSALNDPSLPFISRSLILHWMWGREEWVKGQKNREEGERRKPNRFVLFEPNAVTWIFLSLFAGSSVPAHRILFAEVRKFCENRSFRVSPDFQREPFQNDFTKPGVSVDYRRARLYFQCTLPRGSWALRVSNRWLPRCLSAE